MESYSELLSLKKKVHIHSLYNILSEKINSNNTIVNMRTNMIVEFEFLLIFDERLLCLKASN